jgi:hypothetical protein
VESWLALPVWLLGGWLVTVAGCADIRARALPDAAVAARSSHPVARVRLAEQALAAGDDRAAFEHAARAAASAPLNGAALRVMAVVAERAGDRSRAAVLMNEAVRRSPRDVPALYWLAFDALARQDLDQAVQRFDRLLRVEPSRARDIQPLLVAISGHPAGWRALSATLADAPPWRGDFMRLALGTLSDGDMAKRWLRVAARNGLKLTDSENAMLLQVMVARREWAFVRTQLAAEGYDLGRLRDGGFDGGQRDGLRGWRLDPVKGVDARIANSRLTVEFLGLRAPFRHLQQTLLLAPGQWRFSGRHRLTRLDTALGVRWVVSCLDPARILATGDPYKGDSDWQAFHLDFVVPEDCPAQQIRLELASRIAADLEAWGAVAMDDLAIDPL